jgi:hypothetical protein
VSIGLFRYADIDIYMWISKCGDIIAIYRNRYLYMGIFRCPGVLAIACYATLAIGAI